MSERKFEPIHEVTMYQARCTNCGFIQTDYEEYAGWAEESTSIEWVVDYCGWFRSSDWPPTELLCTKCQECAVCGGKPCYLSDDGKHVLCEAHEDHDFMSVSP